MRVSIATTTIKCPNACMTMAMYMCIRGLPCNIKVSIGKVSALNTGCTCSMSTDQDNW